MARLVFIAGMMGSGKSTTTRRFQPHAFCIHADQIQHDAARRAFPYIKKSHEYSWRAWPRDVGTMHIHPLLYVSVESIAVGIREHSGHLIVEGAILSNDWFRSPLQSVLRDFGHEFVDSDVMHLHLNPPAQVVYDYIHRRAEQHEYRRHEKKMFPDIDAVQKHKDGYCRSFTEHIWTVCDSNDALESAIKEFLAATPLML